MGTNIVINSDYSTFKTEEIRDEILECTIIDELREKVIPKLKEQTVRCGKRINEIMKNSGYTKVHFAKLCGVSRPTLDNWLNGVIPQKREFFIRLGLIAEYNLVQMNQFLSVCGKYPELYSKNPMDCVCIFVINNNYGKDAVYKYLQIVERIESKVLANEAELTNKDVITNVLDEKLSTIKDEDELEKFIDENADAFAHQYHRLYAYIKTCIDELIDGDKIANGYALATTGEWSASLTKCMYEINSKKWKPSRNTIISMGIHLYMDVDQINEMLSIAHMGPLYPKNIFEGVIMYSLNNAKEGNIINRNSDLFEWSGLFEVMIDDFIELNIPEIMDFISELGKDSEKDR